MRYAQLNEDNTYLRDLPDTPVEWDENNYCTAAALTRDGKAAQFRVVPLYIVDEPKVDGMVQRCERDGAEFVNGRWQYKWKVIDLSAEEIAANQERAKQNLIAFITNETQSRLDAFARSRNYDGILSACTYATSAIPKFQTEGQYCVNARDATWASLYQIMGEVEAGTRPMPASFADIEPDLPELVWPA